VKTILATTFFIFLSFWGMGNASTNSIVLNEPNFITIRASYKLALTNDKKISQLKKQTDAYPQSGLALAYNATAWALMARETNWIPDKLDYAAKANDFLNKSVQLDPNNVEIRFLRFSFQCNTPDMLGYKKHLKQDKDYLIKNTPPNHPLKEIMKAYYQRCACITANEKKTLLNLLDAV